MRCNLKKINLILILVITACQLFAQMPDFKKPVQEAMKNLSVIPGIWEGKGWQMDMNGEKKYSNVTEKLQWKLDSTVILLEGLGKKDDGTVVHNALAILTYDAANKKYTMNSYLSSGMSTSANFEVIKPNESFKWWFEDGRGGTIRYTITTDGKKWKEVGEYSRDGNQWFNFFEMNLTKEM